MHRDDTVADYQARILRVLVYLQEHLDEVPNLEQLSNVAHLSPFHFHRIFSAFVGETLFQHTRRLRLERAARWLVNSTDSITEIAMCSGYETPAAFSKAFKQHFHCTPSQFREKRQALLQRVGLPPLLQMEGVVMEPTFQTLSDQRVLFVRKTGDYSQSSQQAWMTLMSFAGQRGLLSESTKMIGVSHDSPEVTKDEHCRYDACIPVEQHIEGEGEVGIQTIAGGKFAVFLHEGSYNNLGETYQAIYSQWLPQSSEELRESFCFEVYLNNPANTPAKDLKTEIYIPVV